MKLTWCFKADSGSLGFRRQSVKNFYREFSPLASITLQALIAMIKTESLFQDLLWMVSFLPISIPASVPITPPATSKPVDWPKGAWVGAHSGYAAQEPQLANCRGRRRLHILLRREGGS